MFEKEIKFIAQKEFLDMDLEKPIPSLLNIPEWFKKLKDEGDVPSVKSCMPFLDSLTAGYIIKLPVDLKIKHNIIDPETNKLDGDQYSSVTKTAKDLFDLHNIKVNVHLEVHNTHQLQGSPLVEKNKHLPFHKFINPWTIKTPAGYSCLFTSPMNNKDDRFEIIPGIVDTDTFDLPVNFPFVINGDKYSSLDTIIERGTAIVQVIPFKRDNWKMKIEKEDKTTLQLRLMKHFTRFKNMYKNFIWVKKKWK